MATDRVDLLRRLMKEEMLEEDVKLDLDKPTEKRVEAATPSILKLSLDKLNDSTGEAAKSSDLKPRDLKRSANDHDRNRPYQQLDNRPYSSSDEEWRLGPKEIKKQTKPKRVRSISSVTEQDPQYRSVGELAPANMAFVPILAAAKYPYKFMGASASVVESVSQEYFAHEKFWKRKWTIYYIYPPPSISVKAIHLVPSFEVEALLDQINSAMKLHLRLPSRAEERGFHIVLSENSPRQPHFLGISSTKEAFNILEKQTPPDEFHSQKLVDTAEMAAFVIKMNLALMAGKNKSKGSKEGKVQKRVQQKDVWCRQLRQTQCFLGIRPRATRAIWSAPAPPNYEPGTSLHEYLTEKESFDQKHEQPLADIDPKIPAPFPFDEHVVFVSVDVEAYEKNHAIITEIGISSLDTNEIESVAPGIQGKSWMKHIRSRHFRIKEAVHLVNKDFVNGCPERFEKIFGESEFIARNDAAQVVASCFRPPFAGHDLIRDDGRRKIVLVGHDTKTDVQYLRDLGYDIRNLSNLIEVIDTADLYRALKYQDQPANLGTLLNDLRLSAWNLHNAGNDAAYTLQVLIGIAFKALTSNADRVVAIDTIDTTDMSKEAADRLVAERKEWLAAEEGLDVGGQPIKTLNEG